MEGDQRRGSISASFVVARNGQTQREQGRKGNEDARVLHIEVPGRRRCNVSRGRKRSESGGRLVVAEDCRCCCRFAEFARENGFL